MKSLLWCLIWYVTEIKLSRHSDIISVINRGVGTHLRTNDKIQAIKHLSLYIRIYNNLRILFFSHTTEFYLAKSGPVLLMVNETERDETLSLSSLSNKIESPRSYTVPLQLAQPPPRGPYRNKLLAN